MRIAVVNDLMIAQAALRHVVDSIAGIDVVWTAKDGAEAVERCARDVPDLILMDMVMPVMDGVEATRRIMKESPCPILVVTATVTGNASLVFDALGHGALDAVATPALGPGGDLSGADALIKKVRAIGRLSAASARTAPPPAASPPKHPAAPADAGRMPLIVFGASTGGPQVLAQVLRALPRPLPLAAVIVQHVDAAFAPGLAEWLSRESEHPVGIVHPGAHPAPGHVAIACSGDHLVIDRQGCFAYVVEPEDLPYRPSVDVFFRSLLQTNSAPGVAVLLTGMGRDGSAGLLELRNAGWHTIAQDKASSVVWGMPGAAVRLGAAVETLDIEAVAPAILRHLPAASSS